MATHSIGSPKVLAPRRLASGIPDEAEGAHRRGRTLAGLSVERLGALLADNPTFNGLDADQLEALHGLIAERRHVAAGTYLMREGEVAAAIFILEAGRLEVLKQEEDGDQQHRLAVLEPGMSVGEVALLDEGYRSASVRALEDADVLVAQIRHLEGASTAPLPIDARVKIALGHEIARRLRATNEITVCGLRAKLREMEIRAEMGRFLCRLLIGTSLYMFALGLALAARPYLPVTEPISAAILLAFAISVAVHVKTSSFPASTYGFTTRNWEMAVREAIVFSLPVAGLIVLAKGILIHTVPAMAGLPLLDLYRSVPSNAWLAILIPLLYAVFVPVQEMVARTIQSGLMIYLTGRLRVPIAAFVAALLFSATHLHVALALAIAAFPLGLFWGWLYARNQTLIGVTLSHLMLGLFAFLVVGAPT